MASSGSQVLHGRKTELQRLSAAITDGRSCLIRGVAGIGKTALVHAALSASGRPARTGRAFELLAREPYLALREALGQAISGEPFEVVPVARLALDDRALVIEDLHWCDPDTIAVLNELSAVVPVVATVRTDPGAGAGTVRADGGTG